MNRSFKLTFKQRRIKNFTGIMGGDHNEVHLVKADDSVDGWPRMSKTEVAERLVREAGAEALAHRA